MQNKAILISLSLMLSNAVAAGQTAVPRLTVKMLIAHYSGQIGTPFHQQSADALMKIQFAEGYLSGVADSEQGKVWCDKGHVKPDEINSMVVAELKKFSSHNQHESAAPAVIHILKKKLPCNNQE